MNLIDENYSKNKNSKNIFIFCGIGIAVSLLVIIILLAYVVTIGSNKIELTVDGKAYKNTSKYVLNKDGVLYIGIEDLTKMISKNGYSYKSGSIDVEDSNKCYITNSYESTFFEVGSNQIYKVLDETKETSYYNIEKEIINENGKLYMPISASKVAMNTTYSNNKNKIIITSIASIEAYYNQSSKNIIPDASIVWETTYSNKKLLKEGLVIIKDSKSEKLGIATVSTSYNKKTKTTAVLTEAIIDSKYKSIKYVEQYNQVIVETESGKGIIQLDIENGQFIKKQKIDPQYEDIMPINKNLYMVSKTVSDKVKKYGIIDESNSIILPMEYDSIGIDISKFTNNHLNNAYIIYESLIPVKKDNKYGFVNLNGKVVIKLEYTNLGYTGGNPSSNVLIIPSLNAIIVKQDNTYGIISKSGKVLRKNDLSKVYKEVINGEEQYSVIYNGKKYNAIQFINNPEEATKSTTNTTNNTTNN